MRNLFWVLGALAVAVVVSACGDGSDEFDARSSDRPDPTTTTTHSGGGDADSPLEGRTFLSTDVRGEHQLVEGTQVRLTVEAGRLRIDAGCNSMSGELSLTGDRLVVGDLISTMMGCEPALMAQDEWVAAFFEAGPAFALDGPTLELTGDDATVLVFAEEEPVPDASLVGPTWTATTIVDGDLASSIPGDPPTFVFRDDGTVEVFDGCNRGSGSYEVEGEHLVFGPVSTTDMACPTAALVADLLAEPVGFSIEGDVLALRTSAGAGLDLRAA